MDLVNVVQAIVAAVEEQTDLRHAINWFDVTKEPLQLAPWSFVVEFVPQRVDGRPNGLQSWVGELNFRVALPLQANDQYNSYLDMLRLWQSVTLDAFSNTIPGVHIVPQVAPNAKREKGDRLLAEWSYSVQYSGRPYRTGG